VKLYFFKSPVTVAAAAGRLVEKEKDENAQI